MSVVDLFKEKCSFLSSFHNGLDLFLYPYIHDSVKYTVCCNFGISKSEEILLIRDTGFWNNRDQGLVITDEGLYCIKDNENPDSSSFGFRWNTIVEVSYYDNVFFFKDRDEEMYSIHAGYFFKDTSHYRAGDRLARALDIIAKSVPTLENPYKTACNAYLEYMKNEKYNEAIDVCLQIVNEGLGLASAFYEIVSRIYCEKLKNFTKGLEYASKGIEACKNERNEYFKVALLYDMYCINHANNNDVSARKDCLTVMLNATDQESLDGDVLIKDVAKRDFDHLEKSCVENFITRPYHERKVLMPVREYVNLNQDRVSVIRMDNLPASINFPIGHPVVNQLYVGHPFIPTKYIPYENYQLELVEDKVREFCMLAQSLGATEISIKCINASASDVSGHNQQYVNGEAGNSILKVKGDFYQNRSRRMIDELSHSICIRQEFKPVKKPSIPENMVWYDDEPSWQRLAFQRMNGGLSYHEERIETKKSQMLEEREVTDLKAEVYSLYADMKMTISEDDKSKFTQQENAVLIIKVKFASLDSFFIDTTKITSSIDSLGNGLKDVLASVREPRLLEKMRVKLGVSENSAAELETSLSNPTLTPEEQEYFDEYKEIIEEGVISDRDKRFLEKLKKANDISDERAKEIEKLVSIEQK